MSSAEAVFRIDVEHGDSIAKLKATERSLSDLGTTGKKASRDLDESADVAKMSAAKYALLTGAAAAAGTALVGLASKGLAAAQSFMAGSVRAAIEAEDSVGRLRSALAGISPAAAATTPWLAHLAGQIQATTRYSDDAVMSMQSLAIRIGGAKAAAPEFTRAVVSMASALRMDLNSAGEQLARTLGGNAGRLKELIPELAGVSAEALKTGEAVKIVGQKFKDAAEQDAKTLGGRIEQLKNQWGEAQEAFGKGLTGAGSMEDAIGKISSAVGDAIPMIERLGTALGGVGSTAVWVLEQVSFLADDKGLATLVGGTRMGTLEKLQADKAGTQGEISRLQALLAEQRGATIGRVRPDEMAGKTIFADTEEQAAAINVTMRSIQALSAVRDRQTLAIEGERAALAELTAEQRQAPVTTDAVAGTWAVGGGGVAGVGASAEAATQQLRDYSTEIAALGSGVPVELRQVGDIQDFRTADTTMPVDQDYAGRDRIEAFDFLALQIEQKYADVVATHAQRDALALLSDAQLRDIKSKEKQMAAEQRQIKMKQMFSNAAGVAAGALIDMAISGEFSAKKLLKVTLESISQAATVESMNQMAKGFALMAAHDPGAGAAFTSAAIYAGVAVAAGVGAGAMGGGGGGGGEPGGRGRDEDRESFLSRDNASTRDAASEASRGPGVQLVISGGNFTSTGGPEEFARLMKAEFDRINAESGGRAGTLRL